MNRRTLIGVLAGVLVCALLVAWWFATFERVERESDAPLRGEASYNPLYGLKRVLEARGVKVVSRANFNPQAMALDASDTVVLAADPRTLSRDDVDTLLDWVDDGGHLVFALPSAQGQRGELAERLKLEPVDHVQCVGWAQGGEVDDASFCFNRAFKTAEKHDSYALLLGDKTGYYLGRHMLGDGAWTVLGNLSFLHTERLKRPGYAAFAWQVLAPALHDGGTVHLVYATDVPPLHVLLVRYGWPALVPALLALLAWLWLRSQRFGPLLPVAAQDRRALREHIQATGEFTFRRGRGAALYAPLRRAFDERLRRDDPLLAALDSEAMIAELAARNGMSAAAVQMALVPHGLADPERFFNTIKILTQLRARP